MRILVTTTSFQDCLGNHQTLLKSSKYQIDYLRGPLRSEDLIPIIHLYDGVICGDDKFNNRVLECGSKGKLKILSKYGIGLDKVDLLAAKKLNVKVINCEGVNHEAVAEHVLALILNSYKNIYNEIYFTKSSKWERLMGNELFGKKLGIAGLGRIGKEVIKRAKSFGLKLFAYDLKFDHQFMKKYKVNALKTLEELFSTCDIVSLNMNLDIRNKYLINDVIIRKHTKPGLLLINTSRGEIVNEKSIIYGIENKILRGYSTDVLELEPMCKDHPFLKYDNIYITPHIASRNYETIERQGVQAVQNLLSYLKNI